MRERERETLCVRVKRGGEGKRSLGRSGHGK